MKRYYCIDVNQKSGQKIELYGWAQIKREHGGVIFIDLRDRTGIVQLVFNQNYSPESFDKALQTKPEYVLRVKGEVRNREKPNPDIPTGNYEVWIEDAAILNKASSLPIGVVKQEDVGEELRLKYRYIDLRRRKMRENIVMRHRIISSIRNFLSQNGFIDIETPFLTKSTPEGARDFLVPSRVNKGRFYALPQSPQIFKQLLMVSGFEKYYQIVKCFRDEDLRADRQPEFTQIDLEASFIEEEDIYNLVDEMFRTVLQECYGKTIDTPVARLSYQEAMELYGTDRPDLRCSIEITDLAPLEKYRPRSFIRSKPQDNKKLYGIWLPRPGDISRKMLDQYSKLSQKDGVEVFTWLKCTGGGSSGPMNKAFEDNIDEAVQKLAGQKDVILLGAFGEREKVLPFLGKLRTEIAQRLHLAEEDLLKFCWITDFPLFEWSQEENKIVSVHHPFTSPRQSDVASLQENPYKVGARSYDIVLNGVELGGGSIRIHNYQLQKKILHTLGLNDQEIQNKFGFLLDALQYGAPPHGGIALGLDRIVMILQGEKSIRDVIPFPKTARGTCPLSGSPDTIPKNKMQELGLRSEESPSSET